eukprot:COSAG01_NODE_5083_length_4499_cov_3.985909_4_plen_226_part_00
MSAERQAAHGHGYGGFRQQRTHLWPPHTNTSPNNKSVRVALVWPATHAGHSTVIVDGSSVLGCGDRSTRHVPFALAVAVWVSAPAAPLSLTVTCWPATAPPQMRAGTSRCRTICDPSARWTRGTGGGGAGRGVGGGWGCAQWPEGQGKYESQLPQAPCVQGFVQGGIPSMQPGSSACQRSLVYMKALPAALLRHSAKGIFQISVGPTVTFSIWGRQRRGSSSRCG